MLPVALEGGVDGVLKRKRSCWTLLLWGQRADMCVVVCACACAPLPLSLVAAFAPPVVGIVAVCNVVGGQERSWCCRPPLLWG